MKQIVFVWFLSVNLRLGRERVPTIPLSCPVRAGSPLPALGTHLWHFYLKGISQVSDTCENVCFGSVGQLLQELQHQ